MHCKNVEIQSVTPSPTLSKKHRKKHKRDLVRYHEIIIEPIRRLLNEHRKGEPNDLRRALHICRGHFKTFTEDAPLLGKYSGTYWWTPQVRGKKEAGVLLKDYRVIPPSLFGRSYRTANENPPDSHKEIAPSKDPDGGGRGLVAHNQTQNKIADIVRKIGWDPRSPSPSEPEFDLAWKHSDALFVCELKSLTPENEERQLRLAIGQVIRYRQKLTALGDEPTIAAIAAERQPQDISWEDLCLDEGIVLVWPDIAAERFQAEAQKFDQMQPQNLDNT